MAVAKQGTEINMANVKQLEETYANRDTSLLLQIRGSAEGALFIPGNGQYTDYNLGLAG